MLIIDFNGIMILQVAHATKQLGAANCGLPEIKNYFYRELLSIRKNFPNCGEVVIACDSPNSWRKQAFVYYKAHRKAARAKLPFDWELAMQAVVEIQKELVDNFPYKVLQVDSCEADDIIAVACKHVTGYDHGLVLNNEPITILSNDHDFLQLQAMKNVKQWSPMTNKWLVETDPDKFLFDKILQGDRGDGVPNVLSADDTIVLGVRQKAITQARIDKWTKHFVENNGALHDDLDPVKYARNKTLVDLLNCIPESICDTIKNAYDTTKPASKLKLQSFFISNQMKTLYHESRFF
jgi:5'-3' exonuclease, N-terminal resolvase-like domain/T4 RNase H, C terminal